MKDKFYPSVSLSSVTNAPNSPIKYKLWQVPQELRKRRNNDVFFLEVVFMWNSKDEVHFWLLTCFFHMLCKNPLEFSVRFHWSSPSDLLQFSRLITGTVWGNFTIFPYSEERLKQKGNTHFCGHRLVRVKRFWHFQTKHQPLRLRDPQKQWRLVSEALWISVGQARMHFL